MFTATLKRIAVIVFAAKICGRGDGQTESIIHPACHFRRTNNYLYRIKSSVGLQKKKKNFKTTFNVEESLLYTRLLIPAIC